MNHKNENHIHIRPREKRAARGIHMGSVCDNSKTTPCGRLGACLPSILGDKLVGVHVYKRIEETYPINNHSTCYLTISIEIQHLSWWSTCQRSLWFYFLLKGDILVTPMLLLDILSFDTFSERCASVYQSVHNLRRISSSFITQRTHRLYMNVVFLRSIAQVILIPSLRQSDRHHQFNSRLLRRQFPIL